MQSSMLRHITEDFGNGGTIDGDLTISGDLTVSGGGSLSFDEIIEGTSVIDVDSTTALVVRKNGASGDVFIVDTDNGNVGIGGTPYSSYGSNFSALSLNGTKGGAIIYQDDGVAQWAIRTTDDNTLRFNYSSDLSSEAMRIDSSGNVGIGTSSPDSSHKLTLKTSAVGGDWIKGLQSDGGQGFRISADSGDDAVFELGSASTSDMVVLRADGNSHFNGGNVGIGTTIPDGTLHVHTATAGTVTADVWVDDLVVENSGDGGISILTPSANQGAIAFGDPDDANRAQITYQHNTDTMLITSGGSTALTIDSSQNATFSGEVKSTTNITSNSGGVGKVSLATSGNNAVIDLNNSTPANTVRIHAGGNTFFNGGNVGIGTSSPTSPASVGKFLHIADAGSAGIVLEDTNAGDWEMYNASGVLYFEDRGNSALALALDVNSRISLSNNDSGAHNTIFGYQAGNSIASGGDYNMALGNSALYTEDTGTHSTAIGYASLYSQNVGSGISGNTGVGLETGKFNVTGTLNTWVGYQAGLGASGQSNSQNTGVGYRAGYSITTGSNNTFLGRQTGLVMTDGADNTFVGMNAGMNTVSGTKMVAIGNQSLFSNATTAATGTVAIGYSALNALTSGEKNVAIGFESMLYQTDGANNTVLGYNALRNADNGESDNVVIGKEAGININHASADANVIIGSNAGFGGAGAMSGSVVIGANAMNSTGANNITGAVAVGYNSLTALTSGIDNVSVGYQSLSTVTTGDYNTSLGNLSGQYNETGSRNTYIGYASGLGASGNSNSSNVGLGYLTLKDITTGGANTVVGAFAGDVVTTQDSLTLVGKDAGSSINHNDANGTTAIGAESLALLTNGRYNTAVGYKSLETTANGDRHTAVGYQALGNVTGASDGDNTAIGFNAGHTGSNDLTSGTGNTLIGSSTAVSSATGVNQTVIGQGATGIDNNSVTLGNSSVTEIGIPNASIIRSQATQSFADDATLTIMASQAGGAMVYVYDSSSGGGGAFFVTYADGAVKVAGSSNVTNSDSDGSLCVFKSTSSHGVTIKNRLGATKNIAITVMSALSS